MLDKKLVDELRTIGYKKTLTSDDLIEDLGNSLALLQRNGASFMAQGVDQAEQTENIGYGTTSLEALARLYISVYKKK